MHAISKTLAAPVRYLVYARAPFAAGSIIPVVLGAALAVREAGHINVLDLSLTLAGMVLAHFGVNLLNDYFDFLQGADQNNRHRNPFNGGTPFLVTGDVTPGRYLVLGLASFAAAFFCGVALALRIDGGIGPIAWLMIAGFLGGFFYTAPPLKFAYRGWGELFILLDFGVLPVLGTYYVLTGHFSWPPVIASLTVGALITNVLWINQFPDYASDRDAGKRTLVVRLGTKRARLIYLALLAVSFLSILASPIYLHTSPFAWLGLIGLLPAVAAARILYRYHQEPPRLFKGQALTIVSHLITGALFAAGVLL